MDRTKQIKQKPAVKSAGFDFYERKFKKLLTFLLIIDIII